MNIIFLFLMLATLCVGCGKKSTVKNAPSARKTAEAYGDGKFTYLPIVLPLSDEVIESFDSPLSSFSFLSGFAKIFMDLGIGMGLGNRLLTLTQAFPEIPTEYIKEVRIKRVFFYIEPTPNDGGRKRSWLKRVVLGRGNINFKFLDSLTVNVSPHKTNGSTTQTFKVSGFDKGKDKTQDKIQVLNYARKEKSKYLRNDSFGATYLIKSQKPVATRAFLMDHPKLKDYFERIHILNHSLVVELANDPVLEESFRVILSEESKNIEINKIDLIEKCSEITCLNFKIKEVDLLPLMRKHNGLKIDAYVNTRKVPDSFQLKGYIEFEIKLKLPF